MVLIGLYFLKCKKFDQLVLRIIKIVATRCQILTLKCTKINFGWGSTPDPAGEAYSAPPDPLAGFNGPTSKGRGREGRGGGSPPKLAVFPQTGVCRMHSGSLMIIHHCHKILSHAMFGMLLPKSGSDRETRSPTSLTVPAVVLN